MKTLTYHIQNELEMERIGQDLSEALAQMPSHSPIIIHLNGNLGAGKTTLTRAFLRARGYEGTVKSPTFTLVEPYEFENYTIYHFDLYRLNSPLELEGIGMRDYFSPHTYSFIEWPEKGGALCPRATVEISIEINQAPTARQVSVRFL